MPRVAIFGGGVGGLTAAHELAERGFEVDVYERHDAWGGKARSYAAKDTGTDGRPGFPAEHGFRFFPGFYRHVPDTMRRIPYAAGGPTGSVLDNLVSSVECEFLQTSQPPVKFPARFPRSLAEWRELIRDARDRGRLGFRPGEIMYFAKRMARIAVACDERKLQEYEKIAWWDFVDADDHSPQFQKLLAVGLTRSLVAMKARVASTRTIGDIMLQMIWSLLTPGQTTDRVLNGPTTDAWIEPWRLLLTHGLGVRLHEGHEVTRLHVANGRITGATVRTKGQPGDPGLDGTGYVGRDVQADYYVAAVPVEVMAALITPELKAAAPELAHLDELNVEWMNGIQFYIRRDAALVNGHSIFADSAWALTSISQAQFWKGGEEAIANCGDGRARGILSVDLSNWIAPGTETTRKMACNCTPDEIAKESWAQLLAHLKHDPANALTDADLVGWHLDGDIKAPTGSGRARFKVHPTRGLKPVRALRSGFVYGEDGQAIRPSDRNAEPLLVNTVDSWRRRPAARSPLPNLVFASDYVQTNTDLACMEGANEAARRAVNAILDDLRSSAPRCRVWPLHAPWIVKPLRWLDRVLFAMTGPRLPSSLPSSPPSGPGAAAA